VHRRAKRLWVLRGFLLQPVVSMAALAIVASLLVWLLVTVD
jgi:hypothetical protein